MKKFIRIILFTASIIALPLVGSPHANDTVRIVVDAYNPPHMYLREGRAAGLYPFLVDAIFKHLDQDVIVEALPWKRAMDMAAQGKAGIAGIYKTADRLEEYDFSAQTYEESLLVFVRQDNTFEFNSVNDLKGKRIGTIMGWSYGAEFDKARAERLFEVEAVNRDHLTFKMLVNGRLDCVIASKASGLFEIARNQYNSIVALEKPLMINPTYIAFAKHSDNKKLLLKINETLTRMKVDGEYDQLIEQFITTIRAGEGFRH